MSNAGGGGAMKEKEPPPSSPPTISAPDATVDEDRTRDSQILDLHLGSVGNDVPQISVKFEKTNNEQSNEQNEIPDRLHAVEVKSCSDRTKTLDVLVVPPDRDNQQAAGSGEIELVFDVPDAEAVSIAPKDYRDPLHGHDARTTDIDEAEKSIQGDGEKKRIREECDWFGRNMKSKTSLGEIESSVDEDGCCVKTEEAKEAVTVSAVVSAPSPGENKVVESAHDRNPSQLVIEENRNIYDSLGSHGNKTAASVEQSDMQFVKGVSRVCSSVSNEGTADKQAFDDNSDAKNGNSARGGARKRRKIAMLLAYCGAGYQGMQKNPGAITIEGELEKALTKAGAMPDNFDGNSRRVDWMRAARTDKGVSAVGQVVSGLFYVDPPGFVDRVNSHLPKPIRLLGYKRVTPSFNAKKFCDRRRYEYIIPTFALDPSSHRDRESVLANEGKEGAILKCLECCERGRKIPVRKIRDKHVTEGLETPSTTTAEAIDDDKDSMPAHEAVEENRGLAFVENGEQYLSGKLEQSVDSVPPETEEKNSLGITDFRKADIFRFGEAERKRLGCILNRYVGTHNFHNFTSRIKAEDPSAKRYIVSFEAGEVITVKGMEFVRCTVVGQSFMLHQIRKMIGLAIAVFRGCAPESMIDMALRRDVNVTIPTAPELGLFLDECMYPAYNQKWYETHEEISQNGYEKQIVDFKHEIIYQHIAETECKEGQMALFLHSLNDRNYTDFVAAKEAEKLVN